MSNTSLALSAAILVTVALAPACADKITSDPNTKTSAVLTRNATEDRPDERLSQAITYCSTGQRLHSVIEELSEKSGVGIRSGNTPADWQVRDIPVVVCANEMPLGKLLRSIADATHLALTPSLVKGDKYYRIWRDGKRQRQLTDYFGRKSNAELEWANREWDAWLKVARMPESELAAAAELKPTDPLVAAIKAFAEVFATLPSDTRDKVFSGGKVRLSVKSSPPPVAEALRKLYRDMWAYEQQRDAEAAAEESDDEPSQAPVEQHSAKPELTDGFVNTLEMFISLSKDDSPGVEFRAESVAGAPWMGSWLPEGSYAAHLLGEESEGADEIAPPQTEYAANLRKLDLDNCDGWGLDKKIKLERPKDAPKDDPTFAFADLIADIARASGFSIICEDFLSHKSSYTKDQFAFYRREMSLADVLREMRDNESVSWHIDIESKVLVGSAPSWWDDHTSLAPESVICDLLKKVNGDGAGIEDVAWTLLLPEKQREEWVFAHKDLFHWSLVPRFEPFWRLYANLSAQDKAAAKSESGIRLGRLDKNRVMSAFNACSLASQDESFNEKGGVVESLMKSSPGLEKRMEAWALQRFPELASRSGGESDVDVSELFSALMESFPEINAAFAIPVDPEAISQLKMSLRQPVDRAASPDPVAPTDSDSGMIAALLDRGRYVMIIEGEGINMRIGGFDLDFPVYSAKRTSQLVKEILDKKKKKVAVPVSDKPQQ